MKTSIQILAAALCAMQAAGQVTISPSIDPTLDVNSLASVDLGANPTIALLPSGNSTVSSASLSATSSSSVTISSVSTSSSTGSSSTSGSSSSTSTSTGSSSTITSSATTTTTSGTSSSTSSNTASAPSVSASLVITINAGVSVTKRNRFRRQDAICANGEFISASGAVTDSFAQAATFGINDLGQLQGSGGGLVSTNPGVANALFVAIAPLTITETFAAGTLSWTNAAFTGGAASFCQLNNQIYSVFTAAPAGCVTVTLTTVASDTCNNNNNGAGTNNTTINNISYSDNSYNVNGSVYNNSNNVEDSNNGNVDVTGNGNTVGVNNGNGTNLVAVNSILPSDVLSAFGDNSINFYQSDGTYYYAKFCDSCPIVPVEQEANGDCLYIDTSGATYAISGYTFSSVESATPCPGYSSAQQGVVVYQAATCYSGCSNVGSVVSSCDVCPQASSTVAAAVAAQTYGTVTATVTTINGECYLSAGGSTGESVVTTTVACAACESSSIGVIAPPASITSGAVVTCDSCPTGSQLVTVTPTAAKSTPAGATSTGITPFTGSAAVVKGSGALVLSIMMAVMLL